MALDITRVDINVYIINNSLYLYCCDGAHRLGEKEYRLH